MSKTSVSIYYKLWFTANCLKFPGYSRDLFCISQCVSLCLSHFATVSVIPFWSLGLLSKFTYTGVRGDMQWMGLFVKPGINRHYICCSRMVQVGLTHCSYSIFRLTNTLWGMLRKWKMSRMSLSSLKLILNFKQNLIGRCLREILLFVSRLQNTSTFTLEKDEVGEVVMEDGRSRCPFNPEYKSTAIIVGM